MMSRRGGCAATASTDRASASPAPAANACFTKSRRKEGSAIEEGGRVYIEEDRRVCVLPKDGRRRLRRDLSLETAPDRLRFSRFRHHGDDRARLQDLRNRHRNGKLRHVFQRLEPPFADLLPAARLVQPDDEIRIGR